MATNHLNRNNEGRYSSEPVNLNSILCEYFGFEVLEDLFQSNKEFLQKLCNQMPSSNDEYLWVWRKSTSFSEEDNRSRMMNVTYIPLVLRTLIKNMKNI